MSNLGVHVLFRYSKKTGAINKTMTGIGSAMMQMWALQNTPKTMGCMIFERETGKLVFATYGTADGFPKIKKGDQCEGKTCEDMGIPFSALQEITDDRFDS